MKDKFKDDLLKVLTKHRKVPENFPRNEKIREKYKSMLARGMQSKTARQKLSKEYFMSEKNIEHVLYNKKSSSGNIIIIA